MVALTGEVQKGLIELNRKPPKKSFLTPNTSGFKKLSTFTSNWNINKKAGMLLVQPSFICNKYLFIKVVFNAFFLQNQSHQKLSITCLARDYSLYLDGIIHKNPQKEFLEAIKGPNRIVPFPMAMRKLRQITASKY